MEPLPQLESCLRSSFEAGDERHPSGVSLASYFARAPTRGRRRADLETALLFPDSVRARLGSERAMMMAMDPETFRACPGPRPTVPIATREWLAEAAPSLGKAPGVPRLSSLLRALAALEALSQRRLRAATP